MNPPTITSAQAHFILDLLMVMARSCQSISKPARWSIRNTNETLTVHRYEASR